MPPLTLNYQLVIAILALLTAVFGWAETRFRMRDLSAKVKADIKADALLATAKVLADALIAAAKVRADAVESAARAADDAKEAATRAVAIVEAVRVATTKSMENTAKDRQEG